VAKRKRDHRIKDARGRVVSQLDPFTLRLLRRHEIIPPEALDEITSEIGFGLEKGPRILFIISLVCVLICLSAVVVKCVQMIVGGSFSFRELLRGISPFTGVWVGPVILWVGAYHMRFQRTAKVMLKHLRCPHCGYDLRGLPTGPDDGLTTCPECGCAWLLKSEEVHEQPSAGEHNGG
jgi:hypothetical protein